MADLLLTDRELEELTGLKNRTKQAEELRRLGIDHKIRRDGFPLVSRKAFEVAMGGEAPTKKERWSFNPNAA